jgi:hypothetical protein
MNFLKKVSKNTHISNLIKICPMAAELFHEYRKMDGQTDMAKLIVDFFFFSFTKVRI